MRAAVDDWRRRRAEAYEAALLAELGEDERGAFLVWGDPAIYDSTLAIVEEILARGVVTFEYEVIPGISSVQALAAKHKVALNRVGEPIEITTGRRLAQGSAAEVENVVVMLDADCAFEGRRQRRSSRSTGGVRRDRRRDPDPGALPEVDGGRSSRCGARPGSASAGSWTPTCSAERGRDDHGPRVIAS